MTDEASNASPRVSANAAGAPLPPGVAVHLLAEEDLSEPPGRYAQLLAVELQPAVTEPRHVHGGDEFLSLLAGEGAVEIDGVWTPLEAGSAIRVAAGRTKALRNASRSAPLRVLAFLVLDRERPAFRPVASPR
jgi:quercetin dioxygenase-like cupin family protein